jgi:hypothetical protein
VISTQILCVGTVVQLAYLSIYVYILLLTVPGTLCILEEAPTLYNIVDPTDLSFILIKTNYTCSWSRRRPQKVDKRMVLEHTHGLFIT